MQTKGHKYKIHFRHKLDLWVIKIRLAQLSQIWDQ